MDLLERTYTSKLEKKVMNVVVFDIKSHKLWENYNLLDNLIKWICYEMKMLFARIVYLYPFIILK